MHEQCTIVYPEAVDECTVCSRCTWKLGIYAQYTVVYLEAWNACTMYSSFTWKLGIYVQCSVGVPESLGCMYSVHYNVPGIWGGMYSVQ